MLHIRLTRRGFLMLVACLTAACASNATAGIFSPSRLAGWVYVDRNNDGHLAFLGEPNPEYVIGDVLISLFSKVGNVESFVAQALTDDYGRYAFENIAPGTYVLRQTQPVEYVDGKDTLGSLFGQSGQPVPPEASIGVMTNNTFSDIVLTENVGGDYYNFGERGMAAGYASKRLLLTSAPPPNTGVPEPAAIVFALSAAGASAWQRRRRRM